MRIISQSACFFASLCLLFSIAACKRVKTPAENSSQTDSTATTIVDSTSAAANDSASTTASQSINLDTSTTSSTTTGTSTIAATMPPVGVKYGYLNSLELLAIMPETRAADKKLSELQRSKEASFSSLAQKYQDGMRNLQEKGQDMTRIEQEAKMKEMAELEEKIQKMQMSSGDELAEEKEKLYAPILAKADKYIKQVGKEQGYQYIFDAAALLYADTTKDILPLVKKKMGLK